MFIRCGYQLKFDSPINTPLLAQLNLHPSRNKDLRTPYRILAEPDIPMYDYVDGFGNTCTRLVTPVGPLTLSADFIVQDPGITDVYAPDAPQIAVEALPDDVLVYLLSSRYCEIDRLSDTAWSLFGHTKPGWGRVQAIVEFVHNHITFGYEHARVTKTAWDGFQERRGVCRDFAHLAITFCRCMNVPARYATGYLGDIGVPSTDAPMDFSAWFEVYLGGGVVHVRRAPQPAADRPGADGARPRRDRHRAHDELRPGLAVGLRGDLQRGRGHLRRQRRRVNVQASAAMNDTIRRFGHPATLVAEYPHWLVLLRPEQPALGSLVLAARSEAEAFSDLPPPAFAELAAVVADTERTLRAAVDYARINYLMLMMVDRNVHFHVVPRYDGERTAAGVTVPDRGWPKAPALGEAVALDEPQVAALVAWLRGLWPATHYPLAHPE